MKKKIKSAVISIVVIAVLLLAILIGVIKNAGTVGSDAEANKIGKTNFSFEKGETKNLILYCIFTDEEVENDIIALNFHLRNSPFIGPLAIIHEPETN